MLTRLRIKGFKNLEDVDIRLGPFSCIAGRNAVGKSNVFDAIHFLHLLTQYPLMDAAQRLREADAPKGRSPYPRSLFTTLGDYRVPEMHFSADLLLDRSVEDDFGIGAEAAISSVRYEVALRLNEDEKPERLELTHESLKPIPQKEARRTIGFPTRKEFKDSVIMGARSRPFISTVGEGTAGRQIRVHQEGHGGREVPAPKSSQTVLRGMASSDFPTVLAAHREMESWKNLMLEPSAMRAPSEYRDPQVIDGRGANLPAAIERLRRNEPQDGAVYAELANRLADLIEDVHSLRVVDDEKTETLTLEVSGRDGVFHPARSLSDGTLRFLVLATLAIDPEARGVISLEEPENGMHPERIPSMLKLLKDIAVDPDLAVADDNPLRQVLVNTHSPTVIRTVDANDLIYIREQNVVRGRQRFRTAMVTAPRQSWRSEAVGAPPPTPLGDLQAYGVKESQFPLPY